MGFAAETLPAAPVTLADYLAREETSEVRHEFHDGQVLAMSGGTYFHSTLTTNLTSALRGRLRGRDCVVRDSNLRVASARTRRFFYPDASIVCGTPEFHPEDPKKTTLVNPRVVFEVLGDSTEGYDRGEKFSCYRQIPSLREYVLVAQDRPLVEGYLRQDDGSWNLVSWEGLSASARVRSVDVDLPLTDLYEGVDLPADAPGPEAGTG